MSILNKNRLLPIDPSTAKIASELFELVENMPIISPHGHTEARWFSENNPFENPTDLFVTPDHYVYRMLLSQGVELSSIGFGSNGTMESTSSKKDIWSVFAANYYLFQGTPTRLWLNYVFENLFGLTVPLNSRTAEMYYEVIDASLKLPEFRPRALFDQFNIEVLSTTDSPLDDLEAHKKIINSSWEARIIPAYRPDNVIDPENEHFTENLEKFGELTRENISNFDGYLAAHWSRRKFFKQMGAKSTDHGHPTANTENLSKAEAEALYGKALRGTLSSPEAERFRGQMLLEMARMSIEDNLVMQLHPGSFRNHSPEIMKSLGRDRGFDIPRATDYVRSLKPLLDEVGLDKRLSLILFTLDESALSREIAPLCGVYPSLKIGPPWWFFDSFEGMQRFRRCVTETAGFFNTVGFNDDTRAFCSIPARHDLSRRVDCAYLAELIVVGQITDEEGKNLAHELAYGLAKRAYNL